jgi:hypothetical protein
MTKTIGIGVLAFALLLSGALVGISYGGDGGITEPEVIELRWQVCFGEGECRFYALTEFSGKQTGQITLAKNPLYDADGNRVGHINETCTTSATRDDRRLTPWLCTWVNTFKPGPYTERGTIVTVGNWDSDRPYAITGGTGAYANVRGYATLHGGEMNYTLHLTP